MNITNDAETFYNEFKEAVKNNILTEVIIGQHNRKITLKNGEKIAECNGEDAKYIALRIRNYYDKNK